MIELARPYNRPCNSIGNVRDWNRLAEKPGFDADVSEMNASPKKIANIRPRAQPGFSALPQFIFDDLA